MNIDWSKAPEGATHYQAENKLLRAAWIKVAEGYYWFMITGQAGWVRYTGPVAHLGTLVPIPAEWNGEGLPPVGTVCEIHNPNQGWVQCEIVAHKHFDCGSKPHAIAWIDADTVDQSQGNRFRPTRTPEQIAAEERAKAIDEMAAVYKSNYEGHVKDGCQALYDAGYRKFEIVEGE